MTSSCAAHEAEMQAEMRAEMRAEMQAQAEADLCEARQHASELRALHAAACTSAVRDVAAANAEKSEALRRVGELQVEAEAQQAQQERQVRGLHAELAAQRRQGLLA